jgi:hypothetical protein
VLRRIHVRIGHGDRERLMKELRDKYKSTVREEVIVKPVLFIDKVAM